MINDINLRTAHNGGLIMGQAPYGYDKAKDNAHRLVSNENAWVVKLMFQLDMILQKMYEDKVFGVISDEHCSTMSKKLEDEQTELKKLISESAALIEKHEKKSKNIGDFIELICKYTDITELD